MPTTDITIADEIREAAMRQLARVYTERGNFLSDDDVLDAAEEALGLDADVDDWTENDLALYQALRDWLFDQVTEDEEPEPRPRYVRVSFQMNETVLTNRYLVQGTDAEVLSELNELHPEAHFLQVIETVELPAGQTIIQIP